jgi:hypothetical protein
MPWQAGAVREQHVKRDLPAARVISIEFWNNSNKLRVQIEQPSLIQNHRHAGCGDNLGDRRQIEDAFHGDRRRGSLVCEVAERLQGNQFPRVGYGNRSAGKRFLRNRIFQNPERISENPILIAKLRGRESLRRCRPGIQCVVADIAAATANRGFRINPRSPARSGTDGTPSAVT